MGMDSVNFRFSMDAGSKKIHRKSIAGMSLAGMSLAGMSLAGMSLIVCKVKSAGCFLGGVRGSLLNVR